MAWSVSLSVSSVGSSGMQLLAVVGVGLARISFSILGRIERDATPRAQLEDCPRNMLSVSSVGSSGMQQDAYRILTM